MAASTLDRVRIVRTKRNNIKNNILGLISLLPTNDRRRGMYLLLLVFFTAILDTLGIASIMPLIALLSNPSLMHDNAFMFELWKIVGEPETKQFLLYASFFTLCFLVFTLSVRATTIYLQTKFAMNCEYKISSELTESYLQQDYTWFLNKNSAELGKNILSEASNIVHGGLIPLINILAQGSLSLCILSLLIFIDAWLALVIILTLFFTYCLIFISVSGVLAKIGLTRMNSNETRFRLLNEVFGGIKEIKYIGLEKAYLNSYKLSAEQFATAFTKAQIIGMLPRYILEGISFGGLISVIIYFLSDGREIVEIIPVLSLFAFAGYKLMPALQAVYSAFTQLRFIGPVVERLSEAKRELSITDDIKEVNDKITFSKLLEVSDLSFSYPGSSRQAVNSINLTIHPNELVAFVGRSGSGKTTIVDILLGILRPSSGSILVDGHNLHRSYLGAWRRKIGYVSQDVYLIDSTILLNITLADTDEIVDFVKLNKVLDITDLAEFVHNDLPEGLQTEVGERGLRLSGGQKQRLGIARALYRDPSILILDEATSALDNVTEAHILGSIKKSYDDITIIMIAHRLSTVENCDNIFVLENGRIAGHGTYNYLLKNNPVFIDQVHAGDKRDV